MITALDKVIDVIWKVLRVILVALLTSMIVILVAHIFWRYILNHSLTWSEECLRGLLVWFGMLSVSVLAVRREHVAIVVFKDHMPKKVSSFLSKLTQIMVVLICLLMVFIGIWYTASVGSRLTPAMRIPYAYFYAAVPVSFVPVALFEIRNLLVDLTGKGPYAAIKKPEEDLTGGTEISL